MWFWLSLIALLCWSGSDLFSKIGCRDADDHLAHLKMVIAVGVVMGLHAAYEIFIGGVSVTWHVIWTYLPGYDSEVIMAAGAFVQGSSIELSADGPIRPPYAVYFQGGLTWYHAKLGILMSLQKLVDAGLVTLDQLEEK